MTTMPTTNNRAWGFYGTMEQLADAAWPIAVEQVALHTGECPYAAAAFLDSKSGRHFADEVLGHVGSGAGLGGAIQLVAARWMAFPISRATRLREGFPAGLPYLTCYVVQAAIAAEDCT